MIVFPGNAQHIGTRSEQQDAFGISEIGDSEFLSHGGVLAVVADGMGGLEEGGKASRRAIKTFLEAYLRKTAGEPMGDALERSMIETNDAVYSLAVELGEKGNFGTTLIAAVVHESGMYWIYAGDSRIYLTDGQALTQLTEDHVYGRKLKKAAEKGLIDYDMVLSHPDRESLTSYIGDESVNEIGKGFHSAPLPENFSLLLCTDGLFKFVPEKRIIECYSDDPREWTKKLVDTVLEEESPSQDNITAVCLKIGEPCIRTREVKAAPSKKKRTKLIGAILLLGLAIVACLGIYWKVSRSDSPAAFDQDAAVSQTIVSGDVLPDTVHQPDGNGNLSGTMTSGDIPVSKDIILAVPVKEDGEKKIEAAPKKGTKK
jgi:protein phosphatase